MLPGSNRMAFAYRWPIERPLTGVIGLRCKSISWIMIFVVVILIIAIIVIIVIIVIIIVIMINVIFFSLFFSFDQP